MKPSEVLNSIQGNVHFNDVFFSSDSSQLIQPMANQAQSASARSKPHLVEKVAGIFILILMEIP